MATPTTTKPEMMLSLYGENIEIMSLAKRIKIMVPGGNKLSDSEAQALAQVSLVTKCNPFIGEVWYISGRGPMIGIKGARRHGNEQIVEAGGKQAYWVPDLKPCSGEEAGYKGDLKNLAAAWKCTITDSVSTKAYQQMFLETVNSLRAAGDPDPVGTAREICGKRPEWIGYGFTTESEQTKMNKQAAAMKRAEADALKKKFDIPFGTEVAAADSAAETEAVDWIEAGVATPGQVDAAFPPDEQSENIDLHPMTIEEARQTIILNVNGDERFMGELPAEALNKAFLSEKTTDIQKRAAVLILKTDFNMDPPAEQKKSADQLKKDMGF